MTTSSGWPSYARLARLKQPLVRIRGQWVELGEKDIAAAIAAVGREGRRCQPACRPARCCAPPSGSSRAAGDLPIADVEADGWLGDLLAGAEDRRLRALPTPEGFVGELRPYQERGLGWLAFLGDLGLGACLADDMGLGKTAQLLALLVDERTRRAPGADTSRTIGSDQASATCRRPVRRDRPSSCARCRSSATGSERQHASPPNCRCTSITDRIGSTARPSPARARKAGPGAVDLRSRRARPAAPRHRHVVAPGPRRGAADKEQRSANHPERPGHSRAQRRIAMTGTPVENRLSELWSIMQFLNPGLLGSEKGFRERFAIPDRARWRRRGGRAASVASPVRSCSAG